MNQHDFSMDDFDERLDHAIDALNREAPPARYEHGDPALFNLIETARLVKSLRTPADPDPDFRARAVNRIFADLSWSPTMNTNGIPPASPPSVRAPLSIDLDSAERSRRISRRLHDMSELAAILVVSIIVLGGVVLYQTIWSGSDGNTSAVGSDMPTPTPSLTPATEPTAQAIDPENSEVFRGLTFEEAQEIAPFELIKPDPVPESLKLTGIDVRLASDSSQLAEIYSTYVLANGDMPEGPITFMQSNAMGMVEHWSATEKVIGSRTVVTFHTDIDERGIPLAVYAWTEGGVMDRSYRVSARLAGDVTEQYLEDLIAAMPGDGAPPPTPNEEHTGEPTPTAGVEVTPSPEISDRGARGIGGP